MLAFRDAQAARAAIADEDDAFRSTRLGSLEDRAGREPGGLDRADGEDRMSRETVPLIEVERQDDVLPAVTEEIGGELCRRRRTVDPSGKVERSVAHGFRVRDPDLPVTEFPKDAERRGWDHRGALQ